MLNSFGLVLTLLAFLHVTDKAHAETGASVAHSEIVECDVIVAGGSLSALSSALTAAREGVKTCLIEPTNWAGGQFTSSGISAIDNAWHSVNGSPVYRLARNPKNRNAELVRWMNLMGNQGGCWVSNNCFEPKILLDQAINPAIAAEPNLKVFYKTVVKRVETVSSRNQLQPKAIKSVTGLQRLTDEADKLPTSQAIPLWYKEGSDKKTIQFVGTAGRNPLVIEATEFGDILALTEAPYAIGAEAVEGQPETSNVMCTQSTVFPFVVEMVKKGEGDADMSWQTEDFTSRNFNFDAYNYDKLWSYRRLKTNEDPDFIGQLSMMNWGPGNDYHIAEMFLTPTKTKAQLKDWQGGLNLTNLHGAEERSLAFYRWLRQTNTKPQLRDLKMRTDILDTVNGLSKVPYVRETRRSVGLGGFTLTSTYLRSNFSSQTKNIMFGDRVALGLYAFDSHILYGNCKYPAYLSEIRDHNAVPYSLPLRMLTNQAVANLLPTGKSSAQSFMVNSSTRVHPTEWNLGVAAGAAAAEMISRQIETTGQMTLHYRTIQNRIKNYQPLDWTH